MRRRVAATPAIRITKIYYDSPNADRFGNTSLNAEWVRLTNTTSTNRSLTGWTLKDKTGYTYKNAYLRDGKGVLKDSWALKPTKTGYVVR